MGAAGSSHANFQRALHQRNLTLAVAVARELPFVRLADALALTLLILERDPPRFSTAAARWAARFVLEASPAADAGRVAATRRRAGRPALRTGPSDAYIDLR